MRRNRYRAGPVKGESRNWRALGNIAAEHARNRTRSSRRTDFGSRGVAFFAGRSLPTVLLGPGLIDAHALLKEIIPDGPYVPFPKSTLAALNAAMDAATPMSFKPPYPSWRDSPLARRR